MKGAFLRVADFLKRHRERIALSGAMVLVAVLSFQAGMLQGNSIASAPIVIEKPVGELVADLPNSGKVAGVSTTGSETPAVTTSATDKKDCAFVGSRNSDLYHLPTCAPAKRIKPENIVCFASKEDAENRGYKPGCLK